MAGIGPEYVVNPPPRLAPLHGLVFSAVLVKEPESAMVGQTRRAEGWRAGFVFLPDGCVTATVWDPCSTGSDRQLPDPGQNAPAVIVDPYFTELPFACSTYGFKAVDYQARTLRMIENAADTAIEREFWTGEKMPQNQSLMGSTPNDDAHILNPGGHAAPVAVSPALALTLLTQALADCGTGARGMIHARSGLVEYWTQNTATHEKDDLLVTGARGDIVVAGAGYTGHGPVGQPDPPAGTEWAYATGIVALWRDDAKVTPPEFDQALDRQTNLVIFRGEQLAAVAHDGCCSFAVLVRTPSDDPIPVNVAETRESATATTFTASALHGAPAASDSVTDGWLSILVTATGVAATSASVAIGSAVYPLVQDGSGHFTPLQITAPEGFTLGDTVITTQTTGGSGTGVVTATAFYPPGP